MQMIDLPLTNGDLFSMTGDGVGYIENGAVAIEGNRIDGEVVYEDRRITTIAEDELLESIQRASEEVSAQASKEVRKRKTFQHRLTLEDRY